MSKYVQNLLNLLKDQGFENPSLIIDGFGRTHQTRTKYAPELNPFFFSLQARLMALSRGETSINPNIWNEAKNMETERKQRSAHLPTRPQMP